MADTRNNNSLSESILDGQDKQIIDASKLYTEINNRIKNGTYKREKELKSTNKERLLKQINNEASQFLIGSTARTRTYPS